MKPRFLNVLRQFIDLKKEQWLPPESIENLQRQRLERTISFAAKTEYYSNIISSKEEASNFIDIPITSKNDIKSNVGSFLSNSKNSLRHERTSGSTGDPLDLYFDQRAIEHRAALMALNMIEFGRGPFDLFAEISYDNYTSFPTLPMFGIFRKMHISVFEDEEKIFSILQKARPDILGWYPSVLDSLARINVQSEKPISLKSVFCGAEMLTNSCRKRIEGSFSCSVFQHYGTMEFSTVARECPEEHNLHVNAGSCLVEIVDDKGKPKKSGVGDIVITGLHNDAMPLLRYSIGDRGSWGNVCSCGRGSPILKSLDGRSIDLIVLPSGKVHHSVPLAISLDVLCSMPSIKKFQVIQESEDLFIFRYVPTSNGISNAERIDIVERIKNGCFGEEIRVEFEEVPSIKKGRTGKTQTIISKVRPSI